MPEIREKQLTAELGAEVPRMSAVELEFINKSLETQNKIISSNPLPHVLLPPPSTIHVCASL